MCAVLVTFRCSSCMPRPCWRCCPWWPAAMQGGTQAPTRWLRAGPWAGAIHRRTMLPAPPAPDDVRRPAGHARHACCGRWPVGHRAPTCTRRARHGGLPVRRIPSANGAMVAAQFALPDCLRARGNCPSSRWPSWAPPSRQRGARVPHDEVAAMSSVPSLSIAAATGVTV